MSRLLSLAIDCLRLLRRRGRSWFLAATAAAIHDHAGAEIARIKFRVRPFVRRHLPVQLTTQDAAQVRNHSRYHVRLFLPVNHGLARRSLRAVKPSVVYETSSVVCEKLSTIAAKPNVLRALSSVEFGKPSEARASGSVVRGVVSALRDKVSAVSDEVSASRAPATGFRTKVSAVREEVSALRALVTALRAPATGFRTKASAIRKEVRA